MIFVALGGGNFIAQNKILPGTYINFVSAGSSSATLSERGYVAMALDLDWGIDGEVFTVTGADFQKNSLKIFGYDITHEKLKGLRDLFRNTRTGYFYNLNTGKRAENVLAQARHRGTRGNDLTVIVTHNVDDTSKYDVVTKLGNITVDEQIGVVNMANLVDNDFLIWKLKDNPTAPLEETAGMPLSGGTNVLGTGADHQKALDKFEAYSFNTLGCLSANNAIKGLYAAYTKRMRDEVGQKFQVVLHRSPADHEGVINLENTVSDGAEQDLVYWVTGISAGVAINRSNTNRLYDGEYEVNIDYKQSQLETAVLEGKFILHRVGAQIRVLTDINSFVTFTAERNKDFSSNQTVRVLDQIATDMAVIFNNRYLGIIPNNESGRLSLWADIVSYNRQLETIQAIENFNPDDVVVEKGDTKQAVVVNTAVTPINAMEKLYMTVIVY